MSITNALGAALTGLTAASRRAETVSSNIANAATPGYARRSVDLSSGLSGGRLPGVRVEGVAREEDVLVLTLRREAQASLAGAETKSAFLSGLEAAIGLPGSPGSLTDRLSVFNAALVEAAARPDVEARLGNAVAAAGHVADHLNALSAHVQDARLSADREIGQAVDDLNTALQQIVSLNRKIAEFHATTRDTTSLMDQRQQLIDSVADHLPISQVARPLGAIALYTQGGAVLVDGTAAEFGFDATPEISPHRTLASGALSGLTLNGHPVSTGAERGPIAGGKLAALFELRDETAPAMQAELDALARNLIERFEDAGVDPTLGAADPGLFTDGGLALDLTEELGLSARIAVNAQVDPAQGGAVWRLRDGLGAATPGPAGDATVLNAMQQALAEVQTPGSGSTGMARDLFGLAGDLVSLVSSSAYRADTTVGFFRASHDTLVTAELQDGVDTDREMQELLLIEQAYAANARMISALDEMMQQLLRL